MHPDTNTNAALALQGLDLNNGWHVTKLITKSAFGTGGTFSVAYEVFDGNKKAFLKAISFDAFFQMNQGKDFVAVLKEYVNTFEYEKDILNRCKSKRLSKVATVLDTGQVNVPGYAIPQVPYLIFEMAEGDLRTHLASFSGTLDVAWKLRSLHNIAVGVKQLHGIKISHQDLKPSNVLVFEDGEISKVGDLGRSLCQDIKAPHDNEGRFSGDRNYAPPEAFYGHFDSDWQTQTRQVDLYMFGNLMVFYFTGVTLTALIFRMLPQQFTPMNWKSPYVDVKAYLNDAFYQALSIIKASIDGPHANDMLALIEYCSHADPDLRGRKNKSLLAHNLPFDVVVTRLDIMARKAEYNLYN